MIQTKKGQNCSFNQYLNCRTEVLKNAKTAEKNPKKVCDEANKTSLAHKTKNATIEKRGKLVSSKKN